MALAVGRMRRSSSIRAGESVAPWHEKPATVAVTTSSWKTSCAPSLAGSLPAVDVYDAVTWSSVFPLSIKSVKAGGKPVQLPDFRKTRR